MNEGRNQDRIATFQKEEEPHPVNKELNYITPIEFVDLPSKGRFYPEGHPLKNKEQVEIKYMTGAEEDILASKSLLKKGVVIDRLIQSVLVDKSIKVDSLLLGDKSAIIIATRITGFGEEYEMNITCPSCEEKFNHLFDLSEIKTKEQDEEFFSKIEFTDRDTFFITLPKTGAIVECRMLNGYDEKHLMQLAETKKKKKLQESPLTDQYRTYIVSINGNEDKGFIAEFSKKIPALDSRFLRKTYSEVVPNIDLRFDVECPECDHINDIEMPMGPNFFWPQQ